MLDHHEIGRLKQACDPTTPGGLRDRAILGVLSRGGLRRAELVALDLADFTESAKGEGSLSVQGKGNKERLVPLANGALDVVKDWIVVRGSEPGPLFLPVAKGGTIGTKRLSTQSIYGLLRRMAERADSVAEFSPHDLRRTAGSEMLDAGADLSVVADILGHASVEVTRRSYDRRGEKAMRKAAALVSF
jgi:site-specific recombinase XerD